MQRYLHHLFSSRPLVCQHLQKQLDITTLDRGLIDRISLTHDLDCDIHTLRAMVMTNPHAKVQGQRSVGSEGRVETNGQTDGRIPTEGRRLLHYLPH